MIDYDRTNDVELLRNAAKVLDHEVLRLQEQLKLATKMIAEAQGLSDEDKAKQIRILTEQLDAAYQRARGGSGSERRPRTDKPEAERKPQKGHGPTPQPGLPFKDIVYKLDNADLDCPQCGNQLEPWKGEFAESETIGMVELRFVRTRHRRQKYRCRCGHLENASGVDLLTPGGRYEPDVAIHVSVAKHDDALPYNRQVKQFKRAGLNVTTQTLWDQEWSLVKVMKPVQERLRRSLIKEPVLLADETRWPLLGAKGRKTKNHYIWSAVGKLGVIYEFHASRSNEAGRALLQGFKGTVVADGYVVYTSLAKEMGFTVANDWSHVRRKFIEAESSAPVLAAEFIEQIGRLFLIEREINKRRAGVYAEEGDAICLELRKKESKPLVAEIGKKAMEVRGLRGSPIYRAVKYLENRWDGLQVFLRDPAVPITSNEVERALRTPVLGRKNSLGSKSKKGLVAASVMYSMIGTAKKNGLEPAAYLRRAVDAHFAGEQIPLPHELV